MESLKLYSFYNVIFVLEGSLFDPLAIRGRRSKYFLSKNDDFFVNLCKSNMGIFFTSAHPLFRRFVSDVSANIVFRDFLALILIKYNDLHRKCYDF